MKTNESQTIVSPISITVVTSQGVKEYKASSITRESIQVQGDPYDHYIGRGHHGEILWTINCLIPCVIEYPVTPEKK